MNTLRRQGESSYVSDLSHLEHQLQIIYQPVTPSSHYLTELKSRLTTDSDVSLAIPPKKRLASIIWTIAGLASGALLIVLGVRGLKGMTGNIQQIRNQMQQKRAANLNPVM